MRVLVFDTETTGLPSSKFISPDTLNLWPYIVQFSYIIYDSDKNEIVETSDTIVKMKEGVNIPEESSKLHKITNELSQKKGIEIQFILNNFFNNLKNIDLLVGHNVLFDINMIKVELLRLIYSNPNTDNSNNNMISEGIVRECKQNLHYITNFKNICCTMQETIDLCNIKALDKYGKEYPKFPKLSELHQKLFDSVPNYLHNSFIDILVTLRCFMKIKYNIDLNDNCSDFKELVNINF
jgi:hypothetical protein